jgi:methanogenic corrinoid protein MtbC1
VILGNDSSRRRAEEKDMQGDSSRHTSRTPNEAEPCAEPPPAWPAGATGSTWSNAETDPHDSKLRLARLARAIETDVIPRLVQAHRPPAGSTTEASAALPPAISDTEVQRFVAHILDDSESVIARAAAQWRSGGLSVETLYLDLLGPAARHLGFLWEEDLCDFSTVTVALGRLQRLMREWSPAFGAEVDHPPHGRRALFVQPGDEQHSFGLSMVAEFFRRDGWDVLGGVGGAVTDPSAKVRDEWVDIIGFSVGSDSRIPWLKATIRAARAAARNPDLVVLVGGPPFTNRPELAGEVGADGTARDGREAPHLAERLMARLTARMG